MAAPQEFVFARVKLGDGGSPETFTTLCGLQNVTINTTVNTQDRFVRDCDTPNLPGSRVPKSTGKQLDITASGLTHKPNVALFESSLGVIRNYQIECYSDDGSATGEYEGEYTGTFMLTAANMNLSQEGDSTSEITMVNSGPWVWTPAA